MTAATAGTGPLIPEWTFGNRLRKSREVAGADQREFATMLGVTHGSLASWECDRAKPRDVVTLAKRVQLVTRVPAWWLLGLPRLDSNQQPSD